MWKVDRGPHPPCNHYIVATFLKVMNIFSASKIFFKLHVLKEGQSNMEYPPDWVKKAGVEFNKHTLG